MNSDLYVSDIIIPVHTLNKSFEIGDTDIKTAGDKNFLLIYFTRFEDNFTIKWTCDNWETFNEKHVQVIYMCSDKEYPPVSLHIYKPAERIEIAILNHNMYQHNYIVKVYNFFAND